jgi:Family of unknown function (DUF5686)/CarboxypepD_reg-like domain
MSINTLRPLFWVAFLLFSKFISAQTTPTTRTIVGLITDAITKEPIPYATVGSTLFGVGTNADENGIYELKVKNKVTELRYSTIGYEAKTIQVPRDEIKITINVALSPVGAQLSEVVIKSGKYRNKNNPAVELIELVVKNRDKNRVEKFSSFHEEQYEKTMMGFSNFSEKTKNKRVLKSWKFALDNVDTTIMTGVGVTPVYLQENLQDFYSRKSPKARKILVRGQKTVKFPMMDDAGIDLYLRQLYQEVDLYDNNVTILTNDFLSPIANTAPLFYRYYPADTQIIEGSKVVRLQFFPRNKADMLLQGDLYIALDSTFPVVRCVFTVNPQINLNFVKTLEMEQTFQKTTEGKWVLEEEEYRMDFGVFKKGLGLFGERIVKHSNSELGVEIPDSIFNDQFELRRLLPNADNRDAAFWKTERPVQLSAAESKTYSNIDSLQKTSLFKNVTNTIFILVMGHYKPVPQFEIGRINTFFAFNGVEGSRFRFGGRTRPEFSKRIHFEGYAAYGLQDERWKYGVATKFNFNKGRSYTSFPQNLLRISYQEDLRTPGVEAVVFVPTDQSPSITRGKNDKFFFLKRFNIQWDREFRNRFSTTVGFERREMTPLGSLKFVPTDDILKEGAPIISSKPFFTIRYAPGEEYYTTKNGWRQRIKFKTIWQLKYAHSFKNLLGSQYEYDEIIGSVYKFTRTPPFGYNYCYLEGGGVFGKAPYPFLSVHRANQSFGLRFQAYSLMNFMEFVSDRYVALNMEQAFYGFFLNKIPLIKKLKWRELATVKVLYGGITNQNKPIEGAGLYKLPTYKDGRPLTYTLEKKPYIEASVGVGNIFHIFRVDFVRRFTYISNPATAKYGIRVATKIEF